MDIEARLASIEARLSALETRQPAAARVVASGRPAPWDTSKRQPMPEVRIPAAITGILAAMRAMGWNRFPSETDLHGALAYGVPEEALVEHFRRLLSKYAGPNEAAQAGHHANLRISKTSYDALIDGRGVGFSVWAATPEEQRAFFGYTQEDIDKLSGQYPERLITDYWDFVESGGAQGWTPRQKDPFGNWL